MIAGWYYLFFSTAAQRLSAIEPPEFNSRRVRLRRINGGVMMLLAVSLWGLFNLGDRHGAMLAGLLLAVLVFLAAIVVLAMLDVRLTWQLRRQPGRVRRGVSFRTDPADEPDRDQTNGG